MATAEDKPVLSSNWKKLQPTLPKKEAKSTGDPKSLKRKRPEDKGQKPHKTRKLESIKDPSRKSRKRPHMSSTNGAAKKLQRSKSAPALKAHHEPRDDVGESEDESADSEPDTTITLTATAAPDIVNEGVSQTALAGKYIALDCEMVGYGPNPKDDSQLARVSIVNFYGHQLYDTYVLPQVPVTDYRTHVTGITAPMLKTMGRPFKEAQRDVAAFLGGRILVGHALKNDLDVLQLSHPRSMIRDTSRFAAFRARSMGKTPALRNLARDILGLEIQSGVHSSVEDARTAMLLYRKEKDAFEAEYAGKFGRQGGISTGGASRKKRNKGTR